MLLVPTQALPNQTLQVQLGGQPCTIDIMQYACGLFVNLYIAGELIIGGVIALNLTRIVRNSYLGFIGDIGFVDTEGETDPVYTGLGTRYQLIYLEEADVASD